MQMNKSNVQEIYKKYFDIIDSFFGSIKHYLGDEEDSHIDLGIYIANYPLISDLILDAIEDINEEIYGFWKEHAKSIFDFIKNEDALKCLYSGDISPIILEDFVKKSALYVDTIIIPDPVFNLSLFQEQISLDKKYYLSKLIRHVFNVWKLKELVLADTSNFILVLLPINFHTIKKENREKLLDTANKKLIKYVDLITKQEISDLEKTFEFFDETTSAKKLYSGLKDLHFLPNIFHKFETFNQFLIDFNGARKYALAEEKTIGWHFRIYLQSQFIRVQEHKYFCEKIQAEPIYDYELPWFFYNYDIGGLGIDGAISNALQGERFNWISKAPIKALKVFRENNRLDYMRSIFRTGITDLKAKNDADLSLVSMQLERNLQEAFTQQQSEIAALEKEAGEITKKELPITVGGAIIGFVPYLGNAVSLLTAGRDITKLLQQKNDVGEKLLEKDGNIINLLVRSYDE